MQAEHGSCYQRALKVLLPEEAELNAYCEPSVLNDNKRVVRELTDTISLALKDPLGLRGLYGGANYSKLIHLYSTHMFVMAWMQGTAGARTPAELRVAICNHAISLATLCDKDFLHLTDEHRNPELYLSWREKKNEVAIKQSLAMKADVELHSQAAMRNQKHYLGFSRVPTYKQRGAKGSDEITAAALSLTIDQTRRAGLPATEKDPTRL